MKKNNKLYQFLGTYFLLKKLKIKFKKIRVVILSILAYKLMKSFIDYKDYSKLTYQYMQAFD